MKKKIFTLLLLHFFTSAFLFFTSYAEGATEKTRVVFDSYDLESPFTPKLPEPAEVQPVEVQSQTDKPLPREVVPPRFSIQGIIWNTDKPQAIVDNVIVGIGGLVKEAYILDITKEGIKVLYEDTLFFIESETSVSSELE
ncbi:hypothetical protein ACFL1E_02440 [Candidatus Omnitrophota bacterium]